MTRALETANVSWPAAEVHVVKPLQSRSAGVAGPAAATCMPQPAVPLLQVCKTSQQLSLSLMSCSCRTCSSMAHQAQARHPLRWRSPGSSMGEWQALDADTMRPSDASRCSCSCSSTICTLIWQAIMHNGHPIGLVPCHQLIYTMPLLATHVRLRPVHGASPCNPRHDIPHLLLGLSL